MFVKARYLYKLRPGRQAEAALRAEHHLTRWVWNECVHQFRSGNKPTAAKLDKLLTAARRDADWLRAGSSVVQQQEIRNYAAALRHSFTVPGRGRPRPKTRKNSPCVSLNYTRNGFRITDGNLRLAGGITVPVVWSRDLPVDPTSVRVYEDAAGWWWASFVVEVEPERLPEAPDSSVGVDWGVSTTATATDPELTLDYHNAAAKHARNLKRYQRRMARHAKQSTPEEVKAYRKAKKAAARARRSERWERKERSRKWAQTVAARHRNVAVENFKPKFLAKTTMAKKMHSAALTQLRHELEYAVEVRGGNLVAVPAAYTTMTCSVCGVRAKHRLPLSQRTFRCDDCGYVGDRDVNAARNVRAWAGFNPTLDDGCQSAAPSGTAAAESGIPAL